MRSKAFCYSNRPAERVYKLGGAIRWACLRLMSEVVVAYFLLEWVELEAVEVDT